MDKKIQLKQVTTRKVPTVIRVKSCKYIPKSRLATTTTRKVPPFSQKATVAFLSSDEEDDSLNNNFLNEKDNQIQILKKPPEQLKKNTEVAPILLNHMLTKPPNQLITYKLKAPNLIQPKIPIETYIISEPDINNENNLLFNNQQPPGNRIIDLGHVLTWFESMITSHQLDCNGNLSLKSEQGNGFVSLLTFKCNKCHNMYINETHKNADINKSMVWETKMAGITLEQSNIVFGSVNVPPISSCLYDRLEKSFLEYQNRDQIDYKNAMANLELVFGND